MSFTVYVLRDRHNRIYIGQTQNINRRLHEHETGSSASTQGRGPFRLVYTEECGTCVEAVRREKWLKSGRGREWLKLELEEG